MNASRAALLERLRRDAYREGRFRLASGRESDFFIDCKRVMLTAEGHRLTGEVLCEEVSALGDEARVEGVAGVALGGCSLASAVSLTSALKGVGPHRAGWDALYVRKEPKDHGTGARVEGVAGPRVVLVEDVLTTGGSSKSAIEALRAAGHEVVAVFALIDRDEGARDALAAVGVTARGVFHRSDFVR